MKEKNERGSIFTRDRFLNLTVTVKPENCREDTLMLQTDIFYLDILKILVMVCYYKSNRKKSMVIKSKLCQFSGCENIK